MTDATLIDTEARPTIRFERRLTASLDRAWHAVMDPEEMRSWFPSAVVGERKVGATLRFPFDQNVADAFEGEVIEWEPMKVFAFTWNGDELRIELTPDGDDATVLVFTHRVAHLAVAARNGSGWQMCLANLEAHLGGSGANVEWSDVYGRYLARMGPPLGTPSREWSLTWDRWHHVSAERMWQCLTDPKELEAWMASGPVEIDLRLGGAVRFFGEPNPEVGVIVALEPERRIAYTWGETLASVDWQIEPAEHGINYRLTKHGMPEARAAGWGAGWHSFLIGLDMYAAAGQPFLDEHEPRIAAYRALLT